MLKDNIYNNDNNNNNNNNDGDNNHIDRIKKCVEDIHNIETKHLKDVSSLGHVLSKDTSQLINSITNDTFAKIAVCGTIGSGKTALIRSLLDDIPLPTGNGGKTKRICVVRYAELKDAKVSLCTLDRTNSKLKPIPDKAATSLAQYPTTKEIDRQLLDKFIRWDPSQECKFKEFISKIVLIEYPITLLKCGVELFDIPGYGPNDTNSFKELRQAFLEHMDPHGVLFCFPNSTFTPEDRNIYNHILQTLGIKQPHGDRVFVVNTMFSLLSLAYDLGVNHLNDLDCLMAEVDKLDQMIVKTINFGADHINNSNNLVNFSRINSLEYLERLPNGLVTFNRFIKRLTRWMMMLEHRRLCTSYRLIINDCGRYLRTYQQLCSKSLMNKEVENLEILCESIVRSLSLVVKDVTFEDFVDNHDIYSQALSMAKSINIPNYDEQALCAPLGSHLESSQLTRTLFGVMFFTNIDTPYHIAKHVAKQLFDYVEIRCMVIGMISSVFSLFGARNIDTLKKMDDDFKEKVISRLFKELNHWISIGDLHRLCDKIKGMIDLIKMDIQKFKDVHSQIGNINHLFGLVSASTMSALTCLIDPSYKPVISDQDHHGNGYINLHKGMLQGLPVTIRTLHYGDGNPNSHHQLMFIKQFQLGFQIKYNLKQKDPKTKHKGMITQLGIFKDEARKEWQLVNPHYDCNLLTFVNRMIMYLKWKELVNIAIDIAGCIEVLHSINYVHGSINLENILIKYDNRFDSITDLVLGYCDTVNVVMDNNPTTMSSDVYAFSGILYELIPKPRFKQANIESFSKGEDEHLKSVSVPYRQLIIDCSQSNAVLRPSIKDVKSTLCSIASQL
ncbi:hypothetical protein SAMD00019534_049020 [Acytostelium subglobosum LB1]|uniref:hypothetical protein n=1 Tax=Acytostelium subglobosum LB1 TaxID=1410327 RepID=UPI0006449D9B|nr:hypothetical protein SAMD00019534_049020 [Acytostelium subglobosum LB1]GAM21727.1 hypothetical protein SAMD00019534_049020 [Acytostelium subglobosum LB1]|eukprot:XP_012754827.1 hypothetical protein SAMD00019534_049020 [Acytostelium subglobosum LB1]